MESRKLAFAGALLAAGLALAGLWRLVERDSPPPLGPEPALAVTELAAPEPSPTELRRPLPLESGASAAPPSFRPRAAAPSVPRRDLRIALRGVEPGWCADVELRLYRYDEALEDEMEKYTESLEPERFWPEVARLLNEMLETPTFSGRSDESCQAVFSDVTDGEYWLRIEHAFLACADEQPFERIEVDASTAGNVIEVDVVPCGAAQGRVFDESGDPLSGALVAVFAPDRWISLPLQPPVTTDASGAYRFDGLPAGREIQVAALHPAHAPALGDLFQVELGRLETAPHLFLHRGGVLVLTVRGAGDAAVPEYELELEPEEDFFFHAERKHHVRDPRGLIRLTRLPPGAYSMKVTAPGHQPGSVPLLVVGGSAPVEHTLRLVRTADAR